MSQTSTEAEFRAQKERAYFVYGWICETLGEKVASDWAWNCTPYPFGLPSDKMLEEGLAVAAGDISLHELIAKCEAEMAEAMSERP